MAVRALSVNTGGTWSPRQAEAVLSAIEPEAAAMGLRFRTFDVTTFNTAKRVILIPLCRVHDISVAPDSACFCCVLDAAAAALRAISDREIS